ncbi:MAG: rRNA synthase [Patescibacteria group bacterium]|jgi:23S rRNA pseudouridine1911/1915/1917 synthase|nr:rRNA synthase [Patescibacteria group bacterium]
MSPEIIYENENVLVLNKPAGLVVHGDGKTKEETLCDWILENYPEMENVGEPMDINGEIIKRPGVVHRLDKETSGVIILAKNQETFYFLKEQFQERLAKKVYNTVVWGNIKNDEGVIDAPIGRHSKDFRQWSATRGARGQMREAVTEYKVLARFEDEGEKFVFLEVRPKTGRTHQIRVHMKYLNNPIVGDKLYAENRPYVLGFERVALHARSLTIEIPEEGVKTFEASYPEDFMELLAKL